MRGFALGLTGLVCLMFAGCISPLTTRLPTLAARNPIAEKGSHEFHDPFADSNLGPDASLRPRGYEQPRTEERHGKDVSYAVGLMQGRPVPPEQVPAIGAARPNVVRP